MEATSYSVTISMSNATLSALQASRYKLYMLMALEASDAAGRPLVAMGTDTYLSETQLAWSPQFQAYTAFDTIAVGERIHPVFMVPIEPGQLLTVTAPEGTGPVTDDAPTDKTIGILNRTQTQFACGLALTLDGNAVPICAFPLYGGMLELMTLRPRVFLMFSTTKYFSGVVVERSTGPGFLIDVGGAAERAVSFDINEGWSAGGVPWAQAVAANSNLVPLLIDSSNALAAASEQFLAAWAAPDGDAAE